MSTARNPTRASISRRIASLQGSAPNMPMRSALSRRFTPWRSATSARASAYDGVAHSTRGWKSMISATCRSVPPPEMGTTGQPSRVAPSCAPRPPVNRP